MHFYKMYKIYGMLNCIFMICKV